MARYAYAPICGHHVDLLVEAHLTSSPSDNVYLRALLHRLSGLLSAASRDKVAHQIIVNEISLPVSKSASICPCLILILSHSIKLCVAYDPRGSGKAAHLRVWAALDLAPLKGDAAFLSALADISVNQGSNSFMSWQGKACPT